MSALREGEPHGPVPRERPFNSPYTLQGPPQHPGALAGPQKRLRCAQNSGRCQHWPGSRDPGWRDQGRRPLPHLHLHTQAVEEMSREGQAIHGCECGVNPAWGGRDVAGPSQRSQAGLSATAWPDPSQCELGIFQRAPVHPGWLPPHTLPTV